MKLEMQKLGMKILNIIVFVVLCSLGVLFLLASPVDPIKTQSRIVVGSIFLFCSLSSLIIITLLMKRNENCTAKFEEAKQQVQDEIFFVKELVCSECGELIKIPENMQNKSFIYCEQCGKEIQVPKDNLKW